MSKQKIMIGGWVMVTSKSTSQLVPCMLNEVQIWRIRWPIHPVDIVLPKKVRNNSCTMRSGVVVLKHGRRTNTLERTYDKGLYNLLQIAISVQVTINDIKRSPIIERKAPQAMTLPPPNANSDVNVSEPRIIREEN